MDLDKEVRASGFLKEELGKGKNTASAIRKAFDEVAEACLEKTEEQPGEDDADENDEDEESSDEKAEEEKKEDDLEEDKKQSDDGSSEEELEQNENRKVRFAQAYS